MRLLVDCGSGVTRRLAELGPSWQTITHVAITHFHIDHHGDLPTLIFAWKYGFLPPRSAPVDVIGPVGTAALFARLARGIRRVGHGARISAHDPRDRAVRTRSTSRADCACRAIPFRTRRRAWHIPWSATGGGSSTRATRDPSEALAAWARGCDLLRLRVFAARRRWRIPEHLTPEQCGELAASGGAEASGADALLSARSSSVDIRALVGAHYAGPVTLARDGWYFDIEDE